MSDELKAWVLVPREPTEAMLKAGWEAGVQWGDTERNGNHARRKWAAMVSAAPSEGGERGKGSSRERDQRGCADGSLPVLTADAASPWRDLADDAPECRKGFIRVRTITTYRWHPYKPDGARQMKKAGRWQRIGDYGGWENANLPEGGDWMPYDPGHPRTGAPTPTTQEADHAE